MKIAHKRTRLKRLGLSKKHRLSDCFEYEDEDIVSTCLRLNRIKKRHGINCLNKIRPGYQKRERLQKDLQNLPPKIPDGLKDFKIELTLAHQDMAACDRLKNVPLTLRYSSQMVRMMQLTHQNTQAVKKMALVGLAIMMIMSFLLPQMLNVEKPRVITSKVETAIPVLSILLTASIN